MPLASDLIHLFVYGTLQPGERAFHLCAADVVSHCPAIALGQLYQLPLGYPAMTLGSHQQVQGTVLSFADSPILERLDAYEQHDPDQVRQINPAIVVAEVEYQRCLIPITTPQGIALGNAWAYVMNPQQIQQLQGQYLPQGQWPQGSS